MEERVFYIYINGRRCACKNFIGTSQTKVNFDYKKIEEWNAHIRHIHGWDIEVILLDGSVIDLWAPKIIPLGIKTIYVENAEIKND